MSAGWQVGDLALCVEYNPQTCVSMGALKVGGIYTVAAVIPESYALCLALREVKSGHQNGSYRAFRFRKIRPDEREACEPEFVTLLNRIKRPAVIAPVPLVTEAIVGLNPRAWPPCKHCDAGVNCDSYDPDTSAPLWGGEHIGRGK